MKPQKIRSPRLQFKQPIHALFDRDKKAIVHNLSLNGCQIVSNHWAPVGEQPITITLNLPYSSPVVIHGTITHSQSIQGVKNETMYQMGVRFNENDPRFHEFETWLVRAARAQKEKRAKIFESRDDIQASALLMQIHLKNKLENPL